ncbi:MAG: M20/M25/M40 family metallo-hydrolase [Acidimicrobiia bacterium]|nr:M20/M25/M40 family metallo-hydrolase [Acidimicrobiia bacterium]
MVDDLTNEATALLQDLIRNECVNDGAVESGHEIRSSDLLTGYLEGCGADIEHYEPQPGRRSVLAKLEGSDPTAPTLMLMGHTDVVPVNPDGWTRDPFGAELDDDGMIWGRGAVDMLNLTSTMAVAFKHLAQSGFAPKGTLMFLGVADEEALGTWGAKYLLDHELDAMRSDYVITESGGYQVPTPMGTRLPIMVEEKGTFWSQITVHGTPSHASQAYKTDNALVTAAEIVRRISEFRPEVRIGDTWRRYVEGLGFPSGLTDPEEIEALIGDLPVGLGRIAHSCTHTTMAPTVVHGGTKTNIIPDRVELQVDVRTMPGQSGAAAEALLMEAIGDLADRVEISSNDDPATASPIDTPLWDSLSRVTGRLCEGSALVPTIMTGGTDNRFFRRAGSVGYGFGLFSRRIGFEDYARMFHGHDERVDQESLDLSTQLWLALAEDLLN